MKRLLLIGFAIGFLYYTLPTVIVLVAILSAIYFIDVLFDNGIFYSICVTLLFNSFLYDLTPDSFIFSFISFSTRLISDRIKLL